MAAVPRVHSELTPGPALDLEWRVYGFSTHFVILFLVTPQKEKEREKERRPLKDSNLFIIGHASLIVKASHRQEFLFG